MLYLLGLLALAVVACVVLWMRLRLEKERNGVLSSRCTALLADKAKEIATVEGLRAELTREREAHRDAIKAEREAARKAATKAGRLTTMIAEGQGAEALDEALEGL